MLVMELVIVYSENNTKPANPLYEENEQFGEC
jgi:hypothetical protein